MQNAGVCGAGPFDFHNFYWLAHNHSLTSRFYWLAHNHSLTSRSPSTHLINKYQLVTDRECLRQDSFGGVHQDEPLPRLPDS